MEHHVTIRWSAACLQKTYYFSTQTELSAFMEGVSEASEQIWSASMLPSFVVVEDSREGKSDG